MDGDFLSLAPPVKPPGWPKRISIFLRLLAVDRPNRVITYILSGFYLDDAAALSAIEEAGGLVFAQKLEMERLPDLLSMIVDTACNGRDRGAASVDRSGAGVTLRRGFGPVIRRGEEWGPPPEVPEYGHYDIGIGAG